MLPEREWLSTRYSLGSQYFYIAYCAPEAQRRPAHARALEILNEVLQSAPDGHWTQKSIPAQLEYLRRNPMP